MRIPVLILLALLLPLGAATPVSANPPMAAYLFPAGGQRGTTVKARVGGLFLHEQCGFELVGPGVKAPPRIARMFTLFFEGPLLPMPDSQQAEDYPQDMAAIITLAADAPLGLRRGRLWTAEGAAAGLRFVVGALPEVVEEEIDGDPIAVPVRLPLTINGRIFPRHDIDWWQFSARAGQVVTCQLVAASIGSPLDAHVAILDVSGEVVAEVDAIPGRDAILRFTAPKAATYRVQVSDASNRGSPAHVYRLTLTSESFLDQVFPLGGRRGEKVQLQLHGQEVPKTIETLIPAQAPSDWFYAPVFAGRSTNPVVLDVDDVPEFTAPSKSVTIPAVLNGRISAAGQVDRWPLSLRKGQALTVESRSARLGSPLQIVLTLVDSQGKEQARAEGTPGQPDPRLVFTPPADGVYTLHLADHFRSRGGMAFAYRIRVSGPAQPDFRLHLPNETLNVPRGGQGKLVLAVDRRGGFQDPIALTFPGLPEGIRVTPDHIPAGQGQVELTFAATPGIAIQTRPVTIRGTATVAGQTQIRTATFASTPGLAEIESVLLATTLPVPFKVVGEFQLLVAPCGGVLRKQYRIERGSFTGPLEVRLADRQARHLQGVTGPVLIVPAGATTFEYPVTLPPWMEIGRTCRVCVMTSGRIKEGDSEHTISYSAIAQDDQIVTVVETGRLSVELERGSVRVVPDGQTEVKFRLSRSKDRPGPVKVQLVLPRHFQGVSCKAVRIAAEETTGTLTIRFGSGALGPFNMPATLRATLESAEGPMVAEASLELVP
jgi:hypothetical protein